MNNTVTFNDSASKAVKTLLDNLVLARASAISHGGQPNRAIRNCCREIVNARKEPEQVLAVARHIANKHLCEHELLKVVETFNQLATGELEVVIEGVLHTPTKDAPRIIGS